MRGSLRSFLLPTAALFAAVVIYLLLTLPPAALRLTGSVPDTVAFGAYHIHTKRSDGTGTVDEVAAAAARAGLKFVILTDHDDATHAPEAPAYRHGVLVIDAAEIGTDQGHLVALGLRSAAPYPLAGDATAVAEDVHRLGGITVVAHPDSPNLDLRWRGGLGMADGIEWLNVDSEWRDETSPHLLAMSARSFVRAPEAIASLMSRPDRTFQRWDGALATGRPMFSMAAVDAHARIGWVDGEEPRRRTALAWPGYETLFRTVTQGVELDAPLTGDARVDAGRVLASAAAGRSFSLIRAFGEPAHLEFTATQGDRRVSTGGRVTDFSQPITLHAGVPEAPGARLTLFRDGRVLTQGNGRISTGIDAAPAVYRVEVSLPNHPAPWIVSNAIIVGADVDRARPLPDEAGEPTPLQPLELDSAWAIERDASSTGSVQQDGEGQEFSFRLGGGDPSGQYAALTASVRSLVGADRVVFTARASRPMRVSVQLRLPGGKDGQRWRQSVYLDEQPRTITIRLQDLVAVGVTTSRRPFAAPIQGLLFVVDTVNAKPGADGRVWISKIEVGGR